MKALILNSGLGKRMGIYTKEQPKCMTEISPSVTIISKQLKQLVESGIKEVVITTGAFDSVLMEYCESLDLPIDISYVKNPKFQETNYIYSIYCAREALDDDIILMHGDLVIENEVLDNVVNSENSCMVVSRSLPLPEKDFKATIKDGKVNKVGVDLFNKSVAAQPLYKLKKEDWKKWLEKIVEFCEKGVTDVYAENALNELDGACNIFPLDIGKALCEEVDNPDDLLVATLKVRQLSIRTVYLVFSADILHEGHIELIKKAKKLGRVIIGVLSDEVVATYKRFPLVPIEERRAIFESISGVYKVVDQETLSYKDNLLKYRPDIVVHGDDWKEGFQKPIRDEVVTILASYGGRLVEYPYSNRERYKVIEERTRRELSLPDFRRARLKKILEMKGFATALEAHSGITGLIVEQTKIFSNGGVKQFDAMWVSSLCDSTAKGKPDIELVDMTSRYRTIDDIMEVTTKPIIFDGDTGGLTEHFVYTVRSLERMGVSMIIIEDKTGLKKNSLFGTEVEQTQAPIDEFCAKIKAGKEAQKTSDFMICARIESLILEKGLDDALKRAFAFVRAGADAIMIHSRKKDPTEIFEFLKAFREKDSITPIVLVPTSFNTVYEDEFKERGANIVIYANQLTRTGFPAMKDAAETILRNSRAKECDDKCMSIKEIINLIPGE
ncbi:phosphoenolpyruvate mutase [Lachnobacterium bovis]|uniref:phosphoenolpyruvate mutase n=1 Tax=Lachnobacterium bovis TaxID=140626 RepID=A0A1H9T4F8_9FIRM|nr:phosphoenolpyruvate mutase [Lachnobacterium bovis]SER92048.1 phosphoenolpyruvate phosphomutase [Lachnobacterium bovis]